MSGNHRVLLFLEHEQQTGWVLRAEDSHHPTLLADVLAFDGVDYTLDPLEKAILLWADKSTEPPIARAHRIWAEVDQAIKMHPVGGAYQFVAQKNGISVDQTKKIVSRLKRQPAAFKEHQIFLRWMAEEETDLTFHLLNFAPCFTQSPIWAPLPLAHLQTLECHKTINNHITC